MGAPFLALKKERRKLTQTYFYKDNRSRWAEGDICFYADVYHQKGAPKSNGLKPTLTAAQEYCNAAVQRYPQSTFGTWQVLENAFADNCFCWGLALPDEFLTEQFAVGGGSYRNRLPRQFSSSDILWASHRDMSSEAKSSTLPTSAMTVPFVAFAVAASTDPYTKINMSWNAPEAADVQVSKSGSYGKMFLARASLYADGAPSYDITVSHPREYKATMLSAIIRIPT